MIHDMEHAALIDAVIKAARGQDSQGKLLKGSAAVDTIDLIREISPKISSLRDEAVAAELDAQSAFCWEHAAMLEATWKPLFEQGNEDAAAIIDGQLKLLRELSGRLSRRAAAVRGISEDELRARSLLLLPANAAPSVVTPTLDDGAFIFGCVGPAEAGSDAVVVTGHAVCGTMQTVLTLDDAIAWRNEHLPKCPGPPAATGEEELPAS